MNSYLFITRMDHGGVNLSTANTYAKLENLTSESINKWIREREIVEGVPKIIILNIIKLDK